MQCSTCGKEVADGKKYCADCQKTFGVSNTPEAAGSAAASPAQHATGSAASKVVGGIISAVVLLAFIAFGVYNSLDDKAYETNEDALDAYEEGDTTSAVAGFRQAADEAYTDEAKISALVNLAYAYLAEGDDVEARAAFEEALDIAEPDSLEYHLVSGELTELDDDAAGALAHYTAAYDINPNDAQVNSTLALFYMDMGDEWPDLVDYPKAYAHAKAAYEVDPSNTAVENLAFAAYFVGENEESIAMFLATDLPNEPYNNVWLGYAYWNIGDDVNAEYYFRQGIALGADVPEEVAEFLGE
ncbi:tetratricopeptide repeat protein [Candidatus Uhrbacteria bacterium]|nr:tetratricopeptide repeat protein [Candidatus Uhrbacteria bacterium]